MKTRTNALLGLALGALMTVMSVTANAQTVNDIIKRGKVLIGVNSAVPPYSTVDAKGNVKGYDVDLAHLLAKYLGVPVEITTYVTAARIPALQAGKVDIMLATLAPTPARAQVVMFTMPYSSYPIVLVGPKATQIKSLDDLAGKKIAVSRGSSQEAALEKSAPKGTVLSRFDDDLTSTQGVISHQADGVAIPDSIFDSVVKARPNVDLEIKFVIYNSPLSIAVRSDAFNLRQWLNTTLSYIKANGELDAISMKWTNHKLPKDIPVF